MRHPAAPMVIAVLLGLLGVLMLWGKWRGDGHHEGNPHPDDVPKKSDVLEEVENGDEA
ncbi:hypothetical protein K458DRAFT_300660 [Lentithecium fluviatile CBS 122367]|uniref:Uncharacterized protein n=1 Tax=Lentithecium fluviatile CBS 122367 TaxID=1168545 RepID=A0A6G1J4G5_9PLEO|nr:hypothetical protein K458DRAFT_300660 [Lentithecium fluviatile CBS 122367]